VGSVLVTEVRVTADLWLARAFVRPLDGAREVEETLQGLATAAPFIRKELAKVLHIRRIPELRFLHDTTMDSALRIEEVLREVLPTGREEKEEDESSNESRAGEGEGDGEGFPRSHPLEEED